MLRTGLQLQAAAAVTAAALAVAGCAMMAPRTETYVAPTVGTTYSNYRRDTGSYGASTVHLPGKYLGEQVWRGQRYRAFETPELTLLGSAGGNLDFVAQVRGDTPILTWEPPITWQYPLEVGKTFTRKYSMTIHAAKRTLAVEDKVTIEAYEDTTVPAGTFKAWRVRTVDNFGNDNLAWYAPALGLFIKQNLRRTASNPAGPGTREIELTSYTPGK